MEPIYSTVNKSHINKTTTTTVEVRQQQQQQQEQQELQHQQLNHVDSDITQVSAFPQVTSNNNTNSIDGIYHVPYVDDTNKNSSRKQSIEIYEQQNQPQNFPIITSNDPYLSQNYTIKLHPSTTTTTLNQNSNSLNWSDLDTYLHIFLTFFFGHFASTLLIDGILRNIENLILLNREVFYILYIIFSIAYLAFTVWMLTILWRWWRNVSLLPNDSSNYVPNTPLLKRQQKLIAKNYVFIAAIILAIGLLIYLAIGIIDNRIKYYHHNELYYGETIAFIIKLVIWFVAIIALLALNRDYFIENFSPKKQKNDQQTIVYEVRK